MKLYHVSPKKNHESILKSGVEPLFSQGAMPQCWWVDSSRLTWAIAHTSARHNISVLEIEVWSLDSKHFPRLYKWVYSGVFRTPCRIVTGNVVDASLLIEKPL